MLKAHGVKKKKRNTKQTKKKVANERRSGRKFVIFKVIYIDDVLIKYSFLYANTIILGKKEEE